MSNDLSAHGFITAAWKRGLVIGIVIILCSANVFQAVTTVSKEAYEDVQEDKRDLTQQLRVCNDEAKNDLRAARGIIDQAVKKQDTLESAVINNTETFSNTKKELRHEAQKR